MNPGALDAESEFPLQQALAALMRGRTMGGGPLALLDTPAVAGPELPR